MGMKGTRRTALWLVLLLPSGVVPALSNAAQATILTINN
jgi:hypothetical protein